MSTRGILVCGLGLVALTAVACGNGGGGGAGQRAASPTPPAGESAPSESRHVIVTSEVHLLTDDLDQTRRELPPILTRHEARSDASVLEPGRAVWTLRVPTERHDAFLADLSTLGKAQRSAKSTKDVTEDHTDLAARLKSHRAVEERLLALLADRSPQLEAVISVERELGRVRTEIERLEGRLRQLADQTTYATVTLSVHENPTPVEPTATPTLMTRLGTTWSGSIATLGDFLAAILVFVIALVPWTPLFAVLGGFLWLRSRRRRLQRRHGVAG
ncbi:MAG: hypothetical protein CMJ83_07605 [Planctomycetes bacterium]|nr:hypothetical protein [Planctomycetota bacterium]